MHLYRITREKHLNGFTGMYGSYKDGGRWNLPGHPVLYYASSPGVALLEMANYLPDPRNVPDDYRLGIYYLPDEIRTQSIRHSDLPLNWDDFPYPRSTQIIGTKWLESKDTLCLVVPSVAVCKGLENSIVINPLHQDLQYLKLESVVKELYNIRAFDGL